MVEVDDVLAGGDVSIGVKKMERKFSMETLERTSSLAPSVRFGAQKPQAVRRSAKR